MNISPQYPIRSVANVGAIRMQQMGSVWKLAAVSGYKGSAAE